MGSNRNLACRGVYSKVLQMRTPNCHLYRNADGSSFLATGSLAGQEWMQHAFVKVEKNQKCCRMALSGQLQSDTYSWRIATFHWVFGWFFFWLVCGSLAVLIFVFGWVLLNFSSKVAKINPYYTSKGW